jgi:hypothetical protein
MTQNDLFPEQRGSSFEKRALAENCTTWITDKLLMLGIKLPRSTSRASIPKQYTSPGWGFFFPLDRHDKKQFSPSSATGPLKYNPAKDRVTPSIRADYLVIEPQTPKKPSGYITSLIVVVVAAAVFNLWSYGSYGKT